VKGCLTAFAAAIVACACVFILACGVAVVIAFPAFGLTLLALGLIVWAVCYLLKEYGS